MKKQNISQSNGSNNNKTERVKVYIRVRPFNQDENERGGETPFTNLDVENSMVTIKKEYDVKNYSYDGLYDMNSTQEQIFQKSAKVVIDVSLLYISNIDTCTSYVLSFSVFSPILLNISSHDIGIIPLFAP